MREVQHMIYLHYNRALNVGHEIWEFLGYHNIFSIESKHRLWTPNESVNERNLKCFDASAVTKNLGLEWNFRLSSATHLLITNPSFMHWIKLGWIRTCDLPVAKLTFIICTTDSNERNRHFYVPWIHICNNNLVIGNVVKLLIQMNRWNYLLHSWLSSPT